ncbi:cation efflux protein [Hypoxylon sp. FL1284]|nr:cation efflux protein [Hypoxylon sp. FL1284]
MQFRRVTILNTLFSAGIFFSLATVLAVNALAKLIFREDMTAPLIVFVLSTISIAQSIMKKVTETYLSRPQRTELRKDNENSQNQTLPSSRNLIEGTQDYSSVTNSADATHSPRLQYQAAPSQAVGNNEKLKSNRRSSQTHTGIDMHPDLGELSWAIGLFAASLAIWKHAHSALEYLDPALAVVASLIALWYSVPVIKATGYILLDAVPYKTSVEEIRYDIESLQGVVSAHHLHIWSLDDNSIVGAGHVQVTIHGLEECMHLLKKIRNVFHAYGVHITTLQPGFCWDEEDAGLSTAIGKTTKARPRPVYTRRE